MCVDTVMQRENERGRAVVEGERADAEHPAWCSAEHCYLSEGTRVHEQAPVRWEDREAEVLFESRLLDPADDEHTYVELTLENLRLTWFHYYGILPLEVVRRLRDQLTEHLDAVESEPSPGHAMKREIPPDAGSSNSAAGSAQGAQEDDGVVAGYFIGGCGHPAPLVGPVWRVGPCEDCDTGRSRA